MYSTPKISKAALAWREDFDDMSPVLLKNPSRNNHVSRRNFILWCDVELEHFAFCGRFQFCDHDSEYAAFQKSWNSMHFATCSMQMAARPGTAFSVCQENLFVCDDSFFQRNFDAAVITFRQENHTEPSGFVDHVRSGAK